MQTIQVKYLQATNTRGSRYKAFTSHEHVIVPFNYATDEGEVDAFQELRKKLAWGNYKFNKDQLPNGDYVFTITENGQY